jgi:hypothetical protein
MAGTKAAPGDPLRIAAADWNACLDAAASNRLRQTGIRDQRSNGVGGVLFTVKNSTGADLARFHALGIGDPLFSPTDNADTFKNQFAFDGADMAAGYFGKFAVAQEAIPADGYGLALVSGLTVAEITVGHETHDRADVDPAGGARLLSAYYGAAEIVWKETGTGTKWAVLRIGSWESPSVKAISAASIAADGSGSVTIQRNGVACETVTAWLDWMHSGIAVANGVELLVQFFRDQNKWVILGAECP